jgi:hypothetical protein
MGGALYLTKKLHTRLLKDKQIKRTIVRRGTRGGDFDIHLIYMVLQCFCIPQTFFLVEHMVSCSWNNVF